MPWFMLNPALGKAYRLLPEEDLLQILRGGADSYLIGAMSQEGQVRVLWSDLREQAIPYDWFTSTTEPDFTDVEVIDWGQTLRLGPFEADVTALPYYREPLDAMTLGEAYAKGTETRKAFIVGDFLDSYVSRLGGEVLYYNSSADPPLLTVTPGKGFTVGVHRYLDLERSRYEIAAAIGHYVLHSEEGRKPLVIVSHRDFPLRYREARKFARAFLLDRNDLLESYERVKDSKDHLRALSARYLLQPAIIRQRLNDLGVE